MELVACPSCGALTVKSNFCRGCGESIKTAEVVDAPQSVKEFVGTGYIPGPREKWEGKLWA